MSIVVRQADRNEYAPTYHRLVSFAIDGVVLVAFGFVLFVGLTGGTVFTLDGVRVSIRTTGNPIAFGAALACIRYVFLPSIPLFGFFRWTPADLDRAASFVLVQINAHSGRHTPRIRSGLILVLAFSGILRLVNAWDHPGFTTGDDVEIHEMTLGRLFGESWDIWNLRSALYPMLFVYPFQALAAGVVDHDVRLLVFAGRLSVVVFATLTVWLVYRVTLRLTSNSAIALVAAILLATSRLHLWFGSSELPRPVASAFIMAAFWTLIIDRGANRAALAGVFLGVGAALRFGESVFFAPALVHVAMERRWRDAIVLGAASALTAGACLGVADLLYWGRPFVSFVNAVDFTIVQRASSRGFQPPWYYLVNATDWTNFVFLAFGLAAIATADRRIALWLWIPVAMLSLFPHKEARYVIAVLPFLCIGVAVILGNPAAFTATRRKTFAVFAVLVAVLFEFSNWHFRRSDEAVSLAQQINVLQPSGVAAQQLWRLGGRLYLHNVNGPVVDIRDPVDVTQFLQHNVQLVVLLRGFAGLQVREQLLNRGYSLSEALSTQQYATFVKD